MIATGLTLLAFGIFLAAISAESGVEWIGLLCMLGGAVVLAIGFAP